MSSNDPRGTHPIGVRITTLFVTGHEGPPQSFYYANTKDTREAYRRALDGLRPSARNRPKRRYIPPNPKPEKPKPVQEES